MNTILHHSGKSIEEERRSNPSRDAAVEYPVGSKLRVKYGKGKNIKVYDAKVVEVSVAEGGVAQYKVHYAGWNIRYDEWLKKDRIFSCVDKVQQPKTSPAVHVPPPPKLKVRPNIL